MSQQNVEALKRGVEAYNQRDIEPFMDLFHPEAEWYPFTAQVEGDEAYHGHEGLRQWIANTNATFEESEASIDEIRGEGDIVLALGHLHARFRSGVTLDSEIGWVVRFRDGLAVWGRTYESHAQALEAAGLSE
jgi:ketosteroid isomerase-like protein